MLQLHKDLALQMGMDRKNIVICDNGDASRSARAR